MVPQRPRSEKMLLFFVSLGTVLVLSFLLPLETIPIALSFFIIPIILAANYYGLAGGIGCAALSAALAAFFAYRSGMLLKDPSSCPRSSSTFSWAGSAVSCSRSTTGSSGCSTSPRSPTS